LINEAAVAAALEAAGFACIVLEQLSFAEQIHLFTTAETVVGVHGAGLANLVFAPAAATVIEIMPDSCNNPCFRNIAAAVGCRYLQVPAKATGNKPGWSSDAAVDVARLLNEIRRCEGSAAGVRALTYIR
jgi:capsular polysaccharide biosynthesis protein